MKRRWKNLGLNWTIQWIMQSEARRNESEWKGIKMLFKISSERLKDSKLSVSD